MKYLALLFFAVNIFVPACNNNEQSTDTTNNTTDTPTAKTNETPAPVELCYAKISNKDTVQLRLSISDSTASGSLLYKLHEKDSNKGKLQGVLHGDTLIANYTFQSEGIGSVREVAFLLKDSAAIEGFGKVEERNGQMVFTSRSNLNFGMGTVLKKIPCGY